MILKALTRLLLTVLTLLVIARYVPGIEVDGFYIALIVAILLGLINLTIRPVLLVLTLPITLLSFGLFTFFINAGLFWFVATFVEGFAVAGFFPAFLGALILAVVSWIADHVIR